MGLVAELHLRPRKHVLGLGFLSENTREREGTGEGALGTAYRLYGGYDNRNDDLGISYSSTGFPCIRSTFCYSKGNRSLCFRL